MWAMSFLLLHASLKQNVLQFISKSQKLTTPRAVSEDQVFDSKNRHVTGDSILAGG